MSQSNPYLDNHLIVAYVPFPSDGRSIHFKTYAMDADGIASPVEAERIIAVPQYNRKDVYMYTAPSIVPDGTDSNLLVYFCGKAGHIATLTWSLFQVTIDQDWNATDITEITNTDCDDSFGNGQRVLINNGRSTPAAFRTNDGDTHCYVACGTTTTGKNATPVLSMYTTRPSLPLATTLNSDPANRKDVTSNEKIRGDNSSWLSRSVNSSTPAGQLPVNSNAFVGNVGMTHTEGPGGMVYLAASNYPFSSTSNNLCVAYYANTDFWNSSKDPLWPTYRVAIFNPVGPGVNPLYIPTEPPVLYLLCQSEMGGIPRVQLQGLKDHKPGVIVENSCQVYPTFELRVVPPDSPGFFQKYGSSVVGVTVGTSVYMAYLATQNAGDEYHGVVLVRFDFDKNGVPDMSAGKYQRQVVSKLTMKPAICVVAKSFGSTKIAA